MKVIVFVKNGNGKVMHLSYDVSTVSDACAMVEDCMKSKVVLSVEVRK